MERIMVQNATRRNQRQTRGLTDEQDKTGAQQSSGPQEQMHFLTVLHPLTAKSMASKKAVRSYVARAAHQKLRRDRVLQYQQSKNAQTQDPSQGDRRSKADQSRTGGRELGLRTSSERYPAAPDIPMPRTFNLAWPTCGPIDILSSGRTDPFQSSAVQLTSLEQYLLDHFVQFVIPQSAAYYPRSKSEPGYQEGMIKHWVPFAITDPGIMNGLFFMACRNLELLYENNSYAREAITYNGKCIRSINEAISKDGKAVSDSTIAKVLLLASAEFHAGNIGGTRNHTDAIGEMVRLKGGLQNLGLEGFLKHLVLWHDRTSTSYIGTSPKFMHAAFFEEDASIESLSPGFVDGLDLSLLSREMINILSDICVITRSANGITLPWNDSDYRTLRLSANELEVRLLVMSSHYQCLSSSRVYSQIEECLCLSLRVFVSLMPRESSFPPLGCKHLAARIQSLLYKIMLVPSWYQSADLLLWITFIGAIVARVGTMKEQELAEFYERLRKQVDLPPQTAGGTADEAEFWDLKLMEISSVLNASSKEDIKSHLRRFLWIENLCEMYSGRIWDSLAI